MDTQAPARSPIVSSEQELLICVDPQDQPVGSATKAECHNGAGKLHRAFSIFVFNEHGQLLLQQRAQGKRLWPAYWSNSCCSHPRAGESMEEAVARRLKQELGLTAQLRYVYKFEYAAQYRDLGSEHELCSVYVGTTAQQPSINDTEIAAWQWIEPNELTRQLAQQPEHYTPWLQLEWQRLQQDFPQQLPGFGERELA